MDEVEKEWKRERGESVRVNDMWAVIQEAMCEKEMRIKEGTDRAWINRTKTYFTVYVTEVEELFAAQASFKHM